MERKNYSISASVHRATATFAVSLHSITSNICRVTPRLTKLPVALFAVATHLEHWVNFIKMEMEHVPHERPQYPIPSRLIETKLQVLCVQIQVRFQRR